MRQDMFFLCRHRCGEPVLEPCPFWSACLPIKHAGPVGFAPCGVGPCRCAASTLGCIGLLVSPSRYLQIVSLRQLRSFELLRWCWENGSEEASHGWRPLEAVSATLLRLNLLDVVLLPPNLGHLTALTKLAIRFSTCTVSTIGRLDADNQGILEAALPQLRRLASLDVAPVGSGLQQLPPGSWLNSLRTLVVPLGAATASLPVLAAATGLRRFGLSAGDMPVKMEDIQSLLQWAAGRPALQHLTLQQRQFDCDTVSNLLRLQRSRLELTVQTEECVDVP